MIRSSFKYYKRLLKSNNDKIIYECILDGISKCINSIVIDKTLFESERTPLSMILHYVLLDNPGIFYVDTSNICIKTVPHKKIILLSYLYSKAEIEKLEERVQNKVNKIIKSGELAKLSMDYEWELYIHDLIADRVHYEKERISYHKVHSIIGPILYDRSVCEGYSKVFKLICDAVNIPCIVINGTADNDDIVIGGNHSWNVVQIDNRYYHVDITWDSGTKKGDMINHKLFNVNDYDIRKDHKWNNEIIPICNSDKHNYYYLNSNCFDNIYKGKEYITSKLKKGNTTISLRLNDCTYTKRDIVNMINEAAKSVPLKKYRYFRYIYSDDNKRGVINIKFYT